MTDDTEQFEAKLADYVDGNLGLAETREVEAYLDSHPEIRTVITRLMLDSEALRTLPQTAAPMDFSEEFRGQVERDLLLGVAGEKPRARGLPALLPAIAALLIIGLGMGTVGYWLLAKRPMPAFDVAIQSDRAAGESDSAKTGDSDRAAVPERAVMSSPPGTFSRRSASTPDGSADPALAGRSRADDSESTSRAMSTTAPTVAFAAAPTPAAPSQDAIAEPLPTDVAKLIGDVLPGHRTIVCVVETATPAAAAIIDEQVGTLLDTHAAAGSGGLANGTQTRAARMGTAGDDLATRAGLVSNTAAPSAIANAIASTDSGASVRVTRGLSEIEAAQLQSQVNQLRGTATFLSYERPAILPTLTSADIDSKRDAAADKAMLKDAAKPVGALEKKSEEVGGGSPAPAEKAAATTAPTSQPANRVLNRGERLRITLTDPDASNLRTEQDVVINNTGAIALPSLESVDAAGQSTAGLQQEIIRAYQSRGLILHPIVQVQSLDVPGDVAPAGQVAGSELAPQTEQAQGFAMPDDQLQAMAKPDVVDLFVIVRGVKPEPTTQPAATQPTTPTTQP